MIERFSGPLQGPNDLLFVKVALAHCDLHTGLASRQNL